MATAGVLQPVPPTISDSIGNGSSVDLGSIVEDRTALGFDLKAEGFDMSASSFLAERMIMALQGMGYDQDATKKVSDRVAKNTIEATIDYNRNHLLDTDSLNWWLENELLNEEELAQKGIYLNSNEPVSLLDVPAAPNLGISEIRNMKDSLHNMLIARNVRPVRVYVRLNKSLSDSRFGFCLLNVVNTDIGGPSMIQLLDAAFHGEDWSKYLLIKEGYNGVTKLWQDEKWHGHGQKEHSSPVPPISAASEEVDDTQRGKNREDNIEAEEIAAPQAPEVLETKEEVVALAQPATYRDINSIPDELSDSEAEPIEHPAMKELREREATRTRVQHPTWSRAHDSQGLLDIITTQSAGVEGEPISLISHPSGEAGDDFEVVERA